jgi:predicted amidohydrolase YtcJ
MTARALTGGRVLSMDPAIGEPEVLVVDAGRIAAAGDRGILRRFPDAEVHDLGGRTILPGFIDAHNHLSVAALHPLWADLRESSTLEKLQSALREQSASDPHATWVRGAGWSELVSPFPVTRRELDDLELDRPVLVANFGYHHGVVCSRGLEALGIDRATRDPEGGEIVRGPDGEPTGLLLERAWAEANARSMESYVDPARWGDLIEERGRLLARDGITCVHDAACTPGAEAVYAELARSGRLPIGVLAMPRPERWFDNEFPERLDGPTTGEGDEMFRIGPMKFFADGGPNCAIDLHIGGERVTFGHRFPRLAEGAVQAAERGFQIAIHAMGNVGMESALEAFARAIPLLRGGEQRLRLEHATLATPDQIRRLASLGAVGVVQPGFVDLYGQVLDQGTLVGFDEAEWMPFRTLMDEGVRLAASSDDPCGPVTPLATSCSGTTRRSPGGRPLGPKQGLPYEEWLRAYTVGAAYAGGQEGERGSLTPGKRADLVIVEGDLGPEGNAVVVETWVGGDVVYARDGAPR